MQQSEKNKDALDFSVQTERHKCQGYGECAKTLPNVFSLDAEGLVQFHGRGDASDQELLATARRCPYKAIVVVNETTKEQLHPRVRPPRPK